MIAPPEKNEGETMEIVVVGSVAYDSVKTPFGKRDRILGGSASYFSTAASFFSPVNMVAVVGEDFEKEHIDFFNSRNIDTSGLVTTQGRTFFWEGEYGDALNEAVTKDTQLNVFADFSPDLPESYRKADVVFLGNIDPGLQLEVIRQVEKPAFIAADTMNYWIKDYRESLLRTIREVDILLINDSEAKMLAKETNLVLAAEKIREMGPKILVIKQGEYGALLFEESGIFSAPAFPLRVVKDPTGCGDTFAGGFIGYLGQTGDLAPANLRKAVIVGSVLAGFNAEDFSLDRMRTLTMDDIKERYGAFQRLAAFEDL
jgi:sugar/nucleoside kinase (ribokinase family)